MKPLNELSLDVVERILFFAVASYFAAYLPWIIGCGFYTWWFTLLVLAAATVILLDILKVNPEGKAVLITGCDTGFGNATAKKLNDQGYHVFAGCLFEDKGGALELKKAGVEVFKMDVSKDCDLSFISDKLKSKGTKLWAVITNAGLSTFGEVEWVPMDVYEKILSVNLLGTIRTVKACLPFMRECAGSRVITVASMMGRFGAPSRSPYTVSKWGVEGFSEVLRLEMKRWGVQVCVVEPGNFVAATALYEGDAIKRQSDYMWNNMTEEVQKAYSRDYFDKQIETMTYYSKNGNTDTSPVIETMVDAVTHTYPQTRYQIMSPQEKVKSFVATHLPSIVYDFVYYR